MQPNTYENTASSSSVALVPLVWNKILAFSSNQCHAATLRAASMAIISRSPSHVSPFFAPSAFLPSLRPGVPLGPEAICGGGGRTSAQEQQTDNRQQLSGGTLCGSVFLSTLGEWREDKEDPIFFFFSFFSYSGLLTLWKHWDNREKRAAAAQQSRKRQKQIRERSETPLCLTVYITAVDDLHQSFHHQLWISHHTPKTSHRCFFSLLPLPIASEGHDSRCMEGVKSSLCCSWLDAAWAAEASRRSSCQSRSLRYRLLRMGDAWMLAQTPKPYKTERTSHKKQLQEFICGVLHRGPLVTCVNLSATKAVSQKRNASTLPWHPDSIFSLLYFTPSCRRDLNGPWQRHMQRDLHFAAHLLFLL